MSQTSSSTTFSTLWQYCFSSFIQVFYRYDVSNFMSQTSSSTTFSTLWQYCFSSFIQVFYRYDVSNFISQTSSSTTFSTLWQCCFSSSRQVSTGLYLHSRRCCFSQTGLSDFLSHWSQISLGWSLQSFV